MLVDKAEGGYYHARTEHDSPEVDNDVLIATTPFPTGEGSGMGSYLRIGDFAQVRITEAREHELIAVPV